MSFDHAYDELVERISDRVVEKLAGIPPAKQGEPWMLLSLEEASQRLGRSERWVRERVREGKLTVVRLDGGALAFELDDLREFARIRRLGGDPKLEAIGAEWWHEPLA
jgi:excisionase family DNA binding protein